MTKEEWITEAQERIDNNKELIAEIEDMVGSDYSRHRSQTERAANSIIFLQNGIKIMKAMS